MARRGANSGGVALRPWSGLASTAPLLCAVHCISAPALALVAPAFIYSGVVEGVVMTVAVALALAALRGGTRLHGRRAPWLPVVTGIAIWSMVPLEVVVGAPEPALVAAGGLAMFGGLRWNSRLKAAAEADRCACPSCARVQGG